MPDEPVPAATNRQLAARIVATYVRGNRVDADQLGLLLSIVHRALGDLGGPAPRSEDPLTPAVPIRRSFRRDYVVCLECGWRGQVLRRHISVAHGLSLADYRAKWSLSREHPLVAPAYSERRSGIAKQGGLGRVRR